MRRFKSLTKAQHFLSNHAAVSNLFNLRRHLIKASHYRFDREVAFAAWAEAVA
jgi:putative transposase